MRPLDETPKDCTWADIKHQCNLAYFFQHKVETVVLKSVNCKVETIKVRSFKHINTYLGKLNVIYCKGT